MKKQTCTVEVHPLIQLPHTLVVVRHAESTGNIISRDERALLDDPNHAYPLTPRGVDQARRIGKEIRVCYGREYFETSFHSTFKRSMQTLDVIRAESDLSSRIVEDARLDEKWDGIFHDLTAERIETRYPEQQALYHRTGYYHFRAPGGEDCIDVEMRIRSFFADVARVSSGPILILGHGSWMMVLRRLLEGWTVPEFVKNKRDNPPPNCGLFEYARGKNGLYTLTTTFLEEHVEETQLA
jgi:broad specificity phosphatase PhoE